MDVRRVFLAFSVFFLVLGLFGIFLDFYAAYQQLFYRLFHGTEQKLPFMAILLAIFCYLAPLSHLSAVSLPVWYNLLLLHVYSI